MSRNRVQNALRQRKQEEANTSQAIGQKQERAYDCFFHHDDLPSPMENGTLCTLPLKQLDAFPDHEEHFPLYTGQRLDDMVDSIRRLGVQTPILVWKTNNGRYIVISGHNRVNASILAGRATIPAVVRTDLTMETAEDLFFEMNFRQRSLADMLFSQRVLCVAAHYNIMIYRALGNTGPTKSEETSEPSTTKQPNGTLSLPTDGSRYVPKKGDAIACDDGTTYMVTDVSRYGLNPFYSDGKLPEDLPVPSCDWSGFAQPELPSVEVRHFKNSSGDILFVRNLYETRRMQYTLYNLIGQSDTDAKVSLTIDWEIGVGEFWPWRDSEVEKLFYSSPDGHYYVEAWDIYKDGVYQNTRYRIDVR